MKAKDIINKFNIDHVVGDVDKPIKFCSPLDEAKDGCITFCKKGKESRIINGKYVIVVDKESKILFNKNITYFVVKNPFLTFVKIVKALFYEGTNQKNIHPSAILYDNVEIGANTCVDRGSMGNTIIRQGAKIGNLIHIAHNVIIGENTMIVCRSGISGSVKIGKECFIGVGATIRDGVTIGDGAFIGMGSVVTKNVKPGTQVYGNPAREANK